MAIWIIRSIVMSGAGLSFLGRGTLVTYARALDYAHAEVRAHHKALIVETLETSRTLMAWSSTSREPDLFSKAKERERRSHSERVDAGHPYAGRRGCKTTRA